MDSLFFINLDIESVTRYDMKNFMRFTNGVYDPVTADIFNELRNIEAGGQYTIHGEECRPDLISNSIYNDTQYWWIILVYNGFTSVEELKNGEQVRFPRVDLLENYFFTLKAKQDAVDRL